MFVLFFFIFYVFCSLAGVYLNCFGRGNLTAFFCKSKDFKAFLRCSCVHFFLCLFFAIITIICNFFWICKEKISVFQKEERTKMRKAFICERIRTKPDYAEPRRWSCHLLKMSPKNLKAWKWTEPLLKGREGKVRPSMLVFGQCAVASLHTLQHLEEREKKMKTVGNAFVTDQCTKFIFALLLCWFYLIRTQAFSVFSEVSSRVAAPQWDRTIHKCQRVGNSNCMNKRDGLWMTLCSFLIVTRFFFLLFIAFSTPLSLQRWLCSPLLSHHHSFFFLIFSCSLSSLTQGGLWLEAMQRCAQLSVRPLPLLSYSSLACAQCFFVFFFNKTRLHLLLLQGFYRKRI